jgi:hypothetical protein
MKLFAIKHVPTNKIVPNLYFSDKGKAKAKRDELNTSEPKTHVVTPGPDHRRFHRGS